MNQKNWLAFNYEEIIDVLVYSTFHVQFGDFYYVAALDIV